MRRTRPLNAPPSRAAGFSLVEMLVGLAVTGILLMGIVGVFNAGSKVARVETQLADMQQSLRASQRQITHLVRMAGRGGLALAMPGDPVHQGPALSVRNNAGQDGDSGEIAVGYSDSPRAVTNTDIIITRGVFNSPIYQIDLRDPAVFTLFDEGTPTTDLGMATDGTVVIQSMTPTGLPQDLGPMRTSFTNGVPEAMILVSPMDERIVAVVELDVANTTDGGSQMTIAFKIQGLTHSGNVCTAGSGTCYANLYNSGGGTEPVLPNGLNNAMFIGILEEYRYYVRQPPTPEPDTPDEPIPPSPPKLSMARMFPGTEVPYRNADSNLAIDLADNVLDMQVGLAFDAPLGPPPEDQDGDGDVDEFDMVIHESLDGENDDWLFNTPEDNPAVAPWNGSTPQPELYYLRLSLLARSQFRELKYQAPNLVGWEDIEPLRVLAFNELGNRMYHRRFQQTIIELRNL